MSATQRDFDETKMFIKRPDPNRSAAPPADAVSQSDTAARNRARGKKFGLLAFTIAVLSLLMSVHFVPDRVTLRAGEISPGEIHASRSVLYVNNAQTARLQTAAALETPPVYDTDNAAVEAAQRVLRADLTALEASRALRSAGKKTSDIAAEIQARLPRVFTNAQAQHLAALPDPQWQRMQIIASGLITDAMKRDIHDLNGNLRPSRDLQHTQQDLAESANDAFPADEDAAILIALARKTLRPNRLLNEQKTQAARESAKNAIAPVYDRIALGERIIGAGETVTQEHLDKFRALGLLDPRLSLMTGFAVCALAAAMALLVALTIARTLPKLYADTRRLTLLSVIVLLSVFGLKMGSTMLGLQFSSGQLGYLGMMSVAAAGMLVCVLLDTHLAVLIVALLSVQSGLIMNHEIRYTVMTLMSSLVGIASVVSTRRKVNLLTTLGALAAANIALVWLLGLLLNDTFHELLTGTAWAAGSAVFATFLFWFGVLVLEKPFGILTHATLLELSAFDRPLLQQLCATAPGTYAHSMMVGTLAEAGAQAVGANPLLARVGGYYHDIGKMKRPDFFVENQRLENVHGRLSPSLSALIITAHVRDGVDMAKEHRLPDEIRDIIAQHHGTTLIRYFYHQALADCNGPDGVPPGLEASFRYPGPRPQSREAALVMLADSIEAAARCLSQPTPERLKAQIDSIVRDKIEDGQLDDCSLTFLDVKRISEAFLHVLMAMNHGRITYPEITPNATGKPMEVSRPDLRPEAIRSTREEALLENMDTGIAAIEGDAPLENFTPLLGSDDKQLTDEESLRAAGEDRSLDIPRHLSLLEPEILYARHLIEQAVASHQDNPNAAGSPPPAPARRARKGRGERPADR